MSDNVDPVIRQAITNRLTALGGKDITDLQFRYKLGDEALLCLLDIKQYAREYDSAWDVSLAISETNLVAELVQILIMWDRGKRVEAKAKKQNRELTEEEYFDLQVSEPLAVLCLEILTHLTDVKTEQVRVRPRPKASKRKENDEENEEEEENDDDEEESQPMRIKSAQYRYKRDILTTQNGQVLKAAIRLALPILTKSQTACDKRDHQILGMAIRFFKNVLAIEIGPEARLGSDQDLHEDISKSATLKSFQQYQVFGFLLSICAALEDHAQTVLGCIYNIIKGVDVTSVFPQESPQTEEKQERPVTMDDSLAYLLSRENDLLRKNISQKSSRHTRFGAMTSMQNTAGRLVISGEMGLKSTQDALLKLNGQKSWTSVRNINRAKNAVNAETVFLSQAATEIVANFVSQLLDGAFHTVARQVRKFLADVAFDKQTEQLQIQTTIQFFHVISWMLSARRLTKKHFNCVADVFEADVVSRLLVSIYTEITTGTAHRNTKLLHSAIVASTQLLLTTHEMALVGADASRGISASDVLEYRDISEQTFRSVFERDLWPKILAGVLKSPSLPLDYLRAAAEMVHVALKSMGHYYKSHKKDDQLGIIERQLATDQILLSYINLLKHCDELSEKELRWPLAYTNRMFAKYKIRDMFFTLEFTKCLFDTVNSPVVKRKYPTLYKEYTAFFNFFTRRLTSALQEEPERYIEMLFPSSIRVRSSAATTSNSVVSRSKLRFVSNSGLTIEQRIAVLVRSIANNGDQAQLEWLVTRLQDAEQHKFINPKEPFKFLLAHDLESIYLSSDYIQLLFYEFGFKTTSKSCTVPPAVEHQSIIEYRQYVTKYMQEPPSLPQPIESYLEADEKDDVVAGEMSGFISDDESDADINELLNDRRFKATGKKRDKKAHTSHSHEDKRHHISSKYVDLADDETDDERDAAFFRQEEELRNEINNGNSNHIDLTQPSNHIVLSQSSNSDEDPLTPPDTNLTVSPHKRPVQDLGDLDSIVLPTTRRVKRLVIEADDDEDDE